MMSADVDVGGVKLIGVRPRWHMVIGLLSFLAAVPMLLLSVITISAILKNPYDTAWSFGPGGLTLLMVVWVAISLALAVLGWLLLCGGYKRGWFRLSHCWRCGLVFEAGSVSCPNCGFRLQTVTCGWARRAVVKGLSRVGDPTVVRGAPVVGTNPSPAGGATANSPAQEDTGWGSTSPVIDVFVSHVEEDQGTAVDIARSLEGAGYTTWYYERDGVPGIGYLVTVSEAIRRSRCVLLLISREALDSRQISQEVGEALQDNRPILPVLHGITHAEFQQNNPAWRLAIAAYTSVAIPPEGVQAMASRLVIGLESLGIRSKEKVCPNCGTEITEGGNFCHRCHVTGQASSVTNTSGMGRTAAIPTGIRGWNWGAFLLGPIWGPCHRVWISLLIFVPYAGWLIMPFVLGAKGNKWAWTSKRWESVEHFNETQRTWALRGLTVAIVLTIVIVLVYSIFDI